jgi:hypothetical protein
MTPLKAFIARHPVATYFALAFAVYLRLGTGIAQEKDRSETLSCARTWLVSLVEAHLSDFIALLVCSSFHCVVSYV